MTTEKEMPKYRSHKIVHALKMQNMLLNDDGSAYIEPADEGFGDFRVDADWVRRTREHWIDSDDPGYYVVYEDGYTSWSPTEAFENGYTRI